MQFEKGSKDAKKDREKVVLRISVDTTELDDAIKKANQLKDILTEVNTLFGSLRKNLNHPLS